MNYTHCLIPADSIELKGNERPPLSLDGKWWIIRRKMVDVECECLTLSEVIALMQTPEWTEEIEV